MTADQQITVIEPTAGRRALKPSELWAYRELLGFLTWRDLKVRYAQTFLGAVWAVLQPLLTMVVFSLFFGGLADVPSDGVPYPLFAYAALLPWTFFANALTGASNAMVANQSLITKVWFPRLILPVAPMLAGGVDFLLAFVILVGMMVWFGVVPTLAIVWLPLLVLLALITSLGIGLILAAANVRYRDVRYVVPFLVQLWLFATPVAYPASLIDGPWRTIYALNPMVGVVEGFRWALLGADTAPGPILAVSTLAALVALAVGVVSFSRAERRFADVI